MVAGSNLREQRWCLRGSHGAYLEPRMSQRSSTSHGRPTGEPVKGLIGLFWWHHGRVMASVCRCIRRRFVSHRRKPDQDQTPDDGPGQQPPTFQAEKIEPRGPRKAFGDGKSTLGQSQGQRQKPPVTTPLPKLAFGDNPFGARSTFPAWSSFSNDPALTNEHSRSHPDQFNRRDQHTSILLLGPWSALSPLRPCPDRFIPVALDTDGCSKRNSRCASV